MACCSRTARASAATRCTSRTASSSTPTTSSACSPRRSSRPSTCRPASTSSRRRSSREGTDMPAHGTLTLYIDDKAVGRGEIKTQPGNFSLVGEGSTSEGPRRTGHRRLRRQGAVRVHRRHHQAGHRRRLGRAVRITGGTGGIGKAAAIGLASMGARVGITGRDRTRAERATTEIRAESGNPARRCIRRRLVVTGRDQAYGR